MFGRYAIPNITLMLIVCQVGMFVVVQRDPGMWERMVLIPSKVIDGEIYRLFSFLIIPPGTILIWALFFWYLFYLMGTALEGFWGTFRYNLFLLIGYIATVASGFVTPGAIVSNGFLEGTVFLAFAYLNPNFELLVMFILPVRIKWFALLTWIIYTHQFIFGEWSTRLTVASAVLNFFMFFGSEIWYRARMGQRRMAGQARRFAERPPEFLHQCDVCGITDKTHPDMDFRYCSKCSGDQCYCTEHIRDHEHVVESAD